MDVIWVEWDVNGAADDEVDVVALLLDPGVLVSCLGDPIPPKGAADDEVDIVALLDDLDFFRLSSPLKKFSSINGTLGGSMSLTLESDFL
jgi:hypothetical protein